MAEAKSKTVLITLVLMQTAAVIILPFWFVFGAISLMAFDSGYSNEAMIYVGATWIYPVISLMVSILAWVLYNKYKFKAAVIFMSVSLLYPILYFFLLFTASEYL